MRRDFDTAFAQVDLIVSPTSPTVAFGLGSRTDDPLAMYQSDICTIPVNLAGLPAISIPCGLADHLPVGFQLMGPAFSENRLLSAAHALEGALDFVLVAHVSATQRGCHLLRPGGLRATKPAAGGRRNDERSTPRSDGRTRRAIRRAHRQAHRRAIRRAHR